MKVESAVSYMVLVGRFRLADQSGGFLLSVPIGRQKEVLDKQFDPQPEPRTSEKTILYSLPDKKGMTFYLYVG